MLNGFETYSSYKDSGIDWLGSIPSEWDLLPAMRFIQESKIKNEGMIEDQVLSLSYGNIVKKSSEQLTGLVPESFETYQIVEKGDIIIRGTDLQNDKTSLRTGLSKYRGIITSAYLNLRHKEGVSPKYLHYFFHSMDISKSLYKFGSGLRQNLSFEDFKRMQIPDLEKVQQTAIANFLDDKTEKVDRAIAIKKAQIARLQERKQILIQNAVIGGLDPTVLMKDSGIDWIGEVPAHWEVKSSRYMFRSVKRFDRLGDEIKFSVTQNRGIIPTSEMREASTQSESFDAFQLCHTDDLVLNKYKAHLGVFWRAPDNGIITNNYTVFKPLKGVDSSYFELLYHTPVYKSIFWTLVYGVTEGMMPLYNSKFYSMKSLQPPLDEQREIIAYVEAQSIGFQAALESVLSQIRSLKEYRASLINAAVTGKIKVPS